MRKTISRNFNEKFYIDCQKIKEHRNFYVYKRTTSQLVCRIFSKNEQKNKQNHCQLVKNPWSQLWENPSFSKMICVPRTTTSPPWAELIIYSPPKLPKNALSPFYGGGTQTYSNCIHTQVIFTQLLLLFIYIYI